MDVDGEEGDHGTDWESEGGAKDNDEKQRRSDQADDLCAKLTHYYSVRVVFPECIHHLSGG